MLPPFQPHHQFQASDLVDWMVSLLGTVNQLAWYYQPSGMILLSSHQTSSHRLTSARSVGTGRREGGTHVGREEESSGATSKEREEAAGNRGNRRLRQARDLGMCEGVDVKIVQRKRGASREARRGGGRPSDIAKNAVEGPSNAPYLRPNYESDVTARSTTGGCH